MNITVTEESWRSKYDREAKFIQELFITFCPKAVHLLPSLSLLLGGAGNAGAGRGTTGQAGKRAQGGHSVSMSVLF
jgi:hypothetical protein